MREVVILIPSFDCHRRPVHGRKAYVPVAESLLVKHQLRILNCGRSRAPNLRAEERIIAGLCTLFMNPARQLVDQLRQDF